MSELISGKEALIALVNNEDVECKNDVTGMDWCNADGLLVKYFFDPTHMWVFRIKPRTIMIGDMEVPACGSDYKFSEPMYVLNSLDPKEYSRVVLDAQDDIPLYWWRTEAEIKQVVAALRKLFKGES